MVTPQNFIQEENPSRVYNKFLIDSTNNLANIIYFEICIDVLVRAETFSAAYFFSNVFYIHIIFNSVFLTKLWMYYLLHLTISVDCEPVDIIFNKSMLLVSITPLRTCRTLLGLRAAFFCVANPNIPADK